MVAPPPFALKIPVSSTNVVFPSGLIPPNVVVVAIGSIPIAPISAKVISVVPSNDALPIFLAVSNLTAEFAEPPSVDDPAYLCV